MRFAVLLVFGWLLTGCAGSLRKSPEVATAQTSAPEPYVRIGDTPSNLVELQIAVRQFLPERHRGPELWLVGVSHIGSSNYYAAVQKRLDEQTLVLFEGVSGASDAEDTVAQPERTPTSRPAAPAEAGGAQTALQVSMATALGLEFQLEAINYNRTNFRNCDLSVPQLRALIEEQPKTPGEAGAGPGFEGLLQAMQGGSLLDSLVKLGLRFVAANPKLQGLAKLALIDSISEIQGDPSRLQGLAPDMKQLLEVLLQKRNQNILSHLKTELPRRRRADSVAIFYGTGHMPDLERKIRDSLHYHPSSEFWLTAFSVDLFQADISQAEREFLHRLIRSQLQQMSVPRAL
jgi:hypothetical protein